VQIQNIGTLGGNLANASPAADGVPPLYVLDAGLTLRSMRGQRTIAVQDFAWAWPDSDRTRRALNRDHRP
jgi:xanthine dehydrogenase small subunit